MTLFGVRLLLPLSERQWRAGVLLFVSYIAATRLSAFVFSAPGLIFPASGFALGGIFLEGYALWPFVFAASIVGYVLSGASPLYLLFLPAAHTLQAVIGAYILRKFGLDPLFRKLKDMLLMVTVAVAASVIVPTIGSVARALHYHLANIPPSSVTWFSWYIATVFSLLVVTPFVIRWFAKPRFARSAVEWLEIFVSFGFLGALSYLLFFTPSAAVAGISLAYFLLVPLFWIALRLRPRFITLALIILSFFAFGSIYVGVNAVSLAESGVRLFQTEMLLEIIAIIFFVISSLEEDRRMTTNLMKSQVDSLRLALSKLAGQDRAKSEFMAMLAHELRNPLAPIASAIDLLRLEPESAKRSDLLEVMDERMRTVRRLLDDLLDVSRINEKKLSLQKERVRIEDIIGRAVLSTESQFTERGQTLALEVPKESLVLYGDPVRLEQIVSNLLTNASKYSHDKGAVTLTVMEERNSILIVVRDNGVGIERAMLGRIFDPFLQVEQGERTRKGLGIGLSLVRTLVELHDGSVRVESDGKDCGSTFFVRLPLIRTTPTPATLPEKKDATNASAGLSVLVVDDNDSASWGIGKLLELSGCVVSYAYDGEQAMEKALETRPDAVLLDIGLPDQDGYSVAAELREQGYTGLLIALTGYSLPEDQKKAREAGFTEYLVKPVGLADLRRALSLS